MIEILAQITAPRFTAGLVLWDDVVVEAAPIVRKMKGWSRQRVRDHCASMNWKISVVRQETRTDVDARGRSNFEIERTRTHRARIR